MALKPKTKRITVDLPADLYERLAALAADERRELKPQLLVVIERACKLHEGRKRHQEWRKGVRDFSRVIDERYG